MPNSALTCARCGAPLSLDRASPETMSGQVCCCTPRTHVATGALVGGEARIGVSLKARKPGEKKPHTELKHGPSFSTSRQKDVEHQRLIDRGRDQYFELVRDYETGEVLHQAEEPLSVHLGHGSAKKRR